MDHRWVRHTMAPVKVKLGPDGFTFVRTDAPAVAVGCDACGLALTEALFAEPCLSELMDQLEEGGSEERADDI
jgi:hypothetical protein